MSWLTALVKRHEFAFFTGKREPTHRCSYCREHIRPTGNGHCPICGSTSITLLPDLPEIQIKPQKED